MIIFAPQFDLLPVAGNKPVCNTNNDQMKDEILKNFQKFSIKSPQKGLNRGPRCAKMNKNGSKSSKIGQNWLKMAQKWLKIIENRQKCEKMVYFGRKLT